jgi:hypothetical protein
MIHDPMPHRPLTRAGPVVLKPRQGPVAKLVAITVITLFWNAIVGAFVFHEFRHWPKSPPSACDIAFLTPFSLIGVVLILGTLHRLIALRNPRPEVTLSYAALVLGETAEVKWRFSGRYDRMTRLHVQIEGREEATYRRGTTTSTDRRIFHLVDVIDTVKPFEIAIGSGKFTIPDDTMHTLNARNNKIVWELKLHGEIPKWPDVREEFVVQVLPHTWASATATATATGGVA